MVVAGNEVGGRIGGLIVGKGVGDEGAGRGLHTHIVAFSSSVGGN